MKKKKVRYWGYVLDQQLFKKKASTGRHSYLARELRRLFDKYPQCSFCYRTLRLPENHCAEDNMATIEHIYSRLDIRRLIPGCENKIRLCCYRCNQDRNTAETAEFHKNYYNLQVSIIELLNNKSPGV